ncbi:MAG: Uma2 family endonuclease [Marinilabiliaceae bacterium]|nr:Uma2 family endonuclease [Marinilabiliaceae bacterium]
MENLLNIEKYTYYDYLRWTDNFRYELIEGYRKIMAGVSEWHNIVVQKLIRLSEQFWSDNDYQKYFMFSSNFDVILFPEDDVLKSKTTVQPDLGFCKKEKRVGKTIIGAPEFIIEVISSNPSYDYRTKYDLYEKAGVLEYWIVAPREQNISVYLLDKEKNKYNEPVCYELDRGEKVVSVAIPGLELDIKTIFDFRGLE